MTTSDAVESIYREIAQRARARNRQRAAEVRGLLLEWQRTGSLGAEQREQALATTHSLRGSAGTFGQVEVSLAAGELEAAIHAGSGGPPAVVEALLDRIENGLCDETPVA